MVTRTARRRPAAPMLVSLMLVAAMPALLSGTAAARSPSPADRSSTSLAACLILPARTADIGSPLAGVIERVEVERGDVVQKGQLLARLQAEVERALAGAAESRASSEAELRGALAARDLASQRLERARALNAGLYLSRQAVDQAEVEFRLADEKVAQARDSRRVSARESGVSRAQVALREIRAPFDGVVTERFASPGERYEEKPLLRLAEIRSLKVEVVAPSTRFGQIQPGQHALVHPELPGQPARTARVVQIDRVLDPASNTFRVRLALNNDDLSLPAGLRCRVDFAVASSAAAPASATSVIAGSGPR